MPIAYDLPLRVNPMQVETPVETRTRLAQLADLSAQTKTREAQTKNLGLQSETIGLQNEQLQRTISGQRDVEELIRQNMGGGGGAQPQQQDAPPQQSASDPTSAAAATQRAPATNTKMGAPFGRLTEGQQAAYDAYVAQHPNATRSDIFSPGPNGFGPADIETSHGSDPEVLNPYGRIQSGPHYYQAPNGRIYRALPGIAESTIHYDLDQGGQLPTTASPLIDPKLANIPGVQAAAAQGTAQFAAAPNNLTRLSQILPGAPTPTPSPAPPPAPMPQTQGSPTAPMPQMPQGQPGKVAGYSSVMPNWDGVIKGLYQRGRAPEAMALQKTILDNQKLITDVERLHLDNTKTQIETSGKSLELIGRILAGAHDQASYNTARGVIAGMGLPTNDLPPVYDKGLIDQHVKEGLTVQQQFEAQTRALDDEIKRRKEARTATEFPAELAKKESDAIIAGQKAAGTEPIQPADQARIDAENARRVETDRHNQVTEKQGAGRLRVAEQRLAQTTGGVPLTPYQQSIADKLAVGDFNPAQLTRFPDKEALIAGAIAKNPNWSPQTYATKKAFEDPQSKQSQNLGTISRIVGHIGRFEKNSKELGVSPSFLTGVNLSGLAAATYADSHAIASELEKLVSGGVGTEGQVQQWQKSLTSTAPAIRQQAIDEISQLIGSQYEGMSQTYKTTIGADLPIEKYVSPAGRDWMKAKGISSSATSPATPGTPPTISDRAAYDKLPSGSVYIDAGDGQQKRKK